MLCALLIFYIQPAGKGQHFCLNKEKICGDQLPRGLKHKLSSLTQTRGREFEFHFILCLCCPM
jgi:hypothetical protein